MLNRLFETRAAISQANWGAGGEFGIENPAGVTINNQTAFSIVAFYSAVSLISDTISTLPVQAFQYVNGNRESLRPRPAWIDQPDVDLYTRSAHYGQVLVSLMVDGNAFTRIFRDSNGEVVNLICLDPTTVEIKRNALGRKMFIIKGEAKALDSSEIIHLTDLLEPGSLRGMSRVSKLSDALGVASALQKYAGTFFGSGSQTSGVIEYPGALTPDQAKSLAQGFDNRHSGWRKSGRTGVLSGGASYKQTSVANDQAQFLESRRFAVEEIGRLYNIPLSMMGVPGAQSYASVEANSINFVTHTLRPYISKIETSYSRLLPEGAYIRLNVEGLLRGDFNSRISAYSVAIQGGWMSINDIRRIEDMSPVENGDSYRVPLANVDLNAAGLVAEETKVTMAKELIQLGFDPTDVLQKLELPAIVHDGGVPTTLQAGA